VLLNPPEHFEIVSIEDDTSGEAGGFPLPDSNTVTTYSPALYSGPFTRWCEGETWTTPSVTETIVTTPGGTSTESTDPWDGIVESTSESVTTPAGTFDCVCSEITFSGGSLAGATTRQCVSKDLGVLINQELRAPGPGGEILGSFEATDIN